MGFLFKRNVKRESHATPVPSVREAKVSFSLKFRSDHWVVVDKLVLQCKRLILYICIYIYTYYTQYTIYIYMERLCIYIYMYIYIYITRSTSKAEVSGKEIPFFIQNGAINTCLETSWPDRFFFASTERWKKIDIHIYVYIIHIYVYIIHIYIYLYI